MAYVRFITDNFPAASLGHVCNDIRSGTVQARAIRKSLSRSTGTLGAIGLLIIYEGEGMG